MLLLYGQDAQGKLKRDGPAGLRIIRLRALRLLTLEEVVKCFVCNVIHK